MGLFQEARGFLARMTKAARTGDAANVLPLPNRNRAGQSPRWANQIASWQAEVQPVKPEQAREGRDNSVVSICLHWIASSWLVAVPQIGTMQGKDFKPLPSHPFIDCLTDSLVGDAYDVLMWRLLTDYICKGNAYAYILRGNNGQLLGFEWLPARCIRPLPNDNGRLDYYAYTPVGGTNGGAYPILPGDIVHIRHGVQEDFPLLGVSPLAAQYREIVTDNAYSDYAAGLAGNGGVPPLMFTPKLIRTADGETQVDLDAETAKNLQRDLADKIRKSPGEPRIIPGALDMHQMGMEPDKMALTEVRAMPETRIPAALGLPAALLQLYTGLQKSTDNNIKESIKQGWRGCLIPLLRMFARQFTVQALRQDDDARNKRLVLWFDTSDVPELAEDTTSAREADRADFQAGILTLSETRARQGLTTNAKALAELKPEPEPVPDPAPEPGTDPAEGQGGGKSKPGKAAKGITRKNTTGKKVGNIYAVADAHRRALLADEQEKVDELSGFYETMREGLAADLDDLLAAIGALQEEGQPTPEAMTALQNRLTDLMVQTDARLAELNKQGSGTIADGQRQMIGTATSSLEQLAQAAAGKPPAGVALSWNHLNMEAFETLVGMTSNGSPLADLLAKAGGDLKGDLRQALLDGVARGEHPRTVAAKCAAITGESKARYETIARTEMLRASREAIRQSYVQNADVMDGYIRLAADDLRTCVACWALSGTEHDNSQIMPSHPCCRCTMVPKMKSWAELTGDDSLPDTRPEIISGPDRFAALSEDAQKSILGPGRFALYQAGTPLSAFAEVYQHAEWGPSVRIRNIDETAGNGEE